MKLFKLIDKILAALVLIPPLYMVYRYVRWYMRQRNEHEGT